MKHLGAVLLITGGMLLTACGMSILQGEPEQAEESSKPKTEHTEQTAAFTESSTESTESSESGTAYEFPDLHTFEAKTLDGSSFSPADFAAADVTAINIWSTTCGPCVREMPELAEYAKTLPENLRIMTWCLDADVSTSSADIQQYLTECGFTGITLAAGNGDLETLYNHLMYTPTTIFVDADGNLVAEPLIGAGSIAERYSAQFDAALDSLGIAHESEEE